MCEIPVGLKPGNKYVTMAKLIENNIVITVSTLIKDGVEITNPVTEEIRLALEQVAQELLGDSFVVEVEQT